jgi:hypothetical protein
MAANFCSSLIKAAFRKTTLSAFRILGAYPPEIVQKNMGWPRPVFDQLPSTELYIFEAPQPNSLEADKRFLGDHL